MKQGQLYKLRKPLDCFGGNETMDAGTNAVFFMRKINKQFASSQTGFKPDGSKILTLSLHEKCWNR